MNFTLIFLVVMNGFLTMLAISAYARTRRLEKEIALADQLIYQFKEYITQRVLVVDEKPLKPHSIKEEIPQA